MDWDINSPVSPPPSLPKQQGRLNRLLEGGGAAPPRANGHPLFRCAGLSSPSLLPPQAWGWFFFVFAGGCGCFLGGPPLPGLGGGGPAARSFFFFGNGAPAPRPTNARGGPFLGYGCHDVPALFAAGNTHLFNSLSNCKNRFLRHTSPCCSGHPDAFILEALVQTETPPANFMVAGSALG